VKDADAFLAAAKTAGIPALHVATVGGDVVAGPALGRIPVAELTRINAEWLPRYMSAAD
jgi:hypothetical protein